MKAKIENTNLWISYKLEKNLSQFLNYYDKKVLFSILNPSQVEKIEKILELEVFFTEQYKTSGYLYVPKLVDKEPLNEISKLGEIVEFFVKDFYPLVSALEKEINLDKRNVRLKTSTNSEADLQNLFWNIKYRLNNLKKGKKLLNDIYTNKLKLENVSGNIDLQNYTKGVKGYICGNGELFESGDGTYGYLGNAKIYESLELAKRKQPNKSIFEIEIKLMSPSLTRKTDKDEKIKTLLIKNKIEDSLPVKESKKNKFIKI